MAAVVRGESKRLHIFLQDLGNVVGGRSTLQHCQCGWSEAGLLTVIFTVRGEREDSRRDVC